MSFLCAKPSRSQEKKGGRWNEMLEEATPFLDFQLIYLQNKNNIVHFQSLLI